MSAILIYRFGYRNTPEISVEVPQHKRMKIIRQDTICGVLPCQRRNAVHHLEVHLSDVLTAELRQLGCIAANFARFPGITVVSCDEVSMLPEMHTLRSSSAAASRFLHCGFTSA